MSKTYTKLNKYEDVLYNYEEDLFIKIYPKDEYRNKVSTDNLDKIRIEIDGNNLNLDNSNEEFLEFKLNNENFGKLNGQKDLIIYNRNKYVKYTVNVAGQNDFETHDIVPGNTKLLESNLEFTVGKYGYFNFE